MTTPELPLNLEGTFKAEIIKFVKKTKEVTPKDLHKKFRLKNERYAERVLDRLVEGGHLQKKTKRVGKGKKAFKQAVYVIISK